MAQSIIDDIAVVEQEEARATTSSFTIRVGGAATSVAEEQTEAVAGNDDGVRIKVFGVGGGGGNAVQHMIDSGLKHVVFCAANTDMQALKKNTAQIKIQLGEKLTGGRGAGADPNVGHEAAVESIAAIREAIGDAEMVFVTAGMGGGTGTGAASVIAQAAKEMGVLTVGVVTKPFAYEGLKRQRAAEAGLAELKQHVDCLITIPNDRLKIFAPKKALFKDMLQKANDVLYNAVSGITEVIHREALINLDFADVRTVMSEQGMALMGTGVASGENRARKAADMAISCPLLEDVSLESAKAILYNITAADDVPIDEIAEIGDIIHEAAPDDANIIFGVALDPTIGDELRLTIVATGIEEAVRVEQPQPGAGRIVYPGPKTPLAEQRPTRGSHGGVHTLGANSLLPGFDAAPRAVPLRQPRKEAVGAWTGQTQGDMRPPYQRKLDYQAANGPVHQHQPGHDDFVFDDDVEVPAFIRSQAD